VQFHQEAGVNSFTDLSKLLEEAPKALLDSLRQSAVVRHTGKPGHRAHGRAARECSRAAREPARQPGSQDGSQQGSQQGSQRGIEVVAGLL
jgi:hypothetical protein